MVIDTSAIMAILLREPEAVEFAAAIQADPTRLMSAATVIETRIVIEARKGEAGFRELDLVLYKANIDIVPFTQEQAESSPSLASIW